MNNKIYLKMLLSFTLGIASFTSAYATELYNKDGKTFSIGGYIKESIGNVTNQDFMSNMENRSSRINISGTTQINDSWSVTGVAEIGFDPLFHSTQEQSLWYNRLGYIKLKDEQSNATYTFGRQWSVYYDVAEWTDWYEVTGGDALGVYDGGDDGGFVGTGRANEAISYRQQFGDFKVALQGQGSDTDTSDSTKRDFSASTSIIWDINSAFSIGYAGHYAQLSDQSGNAVIIDNADLSKILEVVGLRYDTDQLTVALNVSYMKNLYTINSQAIGNESYIAYKYNDAGSNVYIGHNLAVSDPDESLSSDSYFEHLYAAVGFLHYITKDFSVLGEYKYDLRSDEDIEMANVYTERNDKFALGFKYEF